MLKEVIDFLIAKKKLASLVQIEKKGQKVADFIKKCNYKNYISFIPNLLFVSLLISNYYPSNFSATTFIQTNNIDY